MANPSPVSYSSPVPKVAGGRHSQPLVIEYDIDTGNISASNRVVTLPYSIDGTVSCKVARTHIHFLFVLDKAKGRRPTITVDHSIMTGTKSAGWRPCWSPDGYDWHFASGFTQLTSPNRVRFQFDEAFSAQRVYVASRAVWMHGHFDTLAATLLADTSGRVTPSSSANASGVLMTSRAGVNDWGTQVGGNSVYGFVLNDSSLSPTLGLRKRELVMTAGVHAGEVDDGWYLRGILDFWLNGVGAIAEQFRREWKVCAYFACNPNGRRAGLQRRSTYNLADDPNRFWINDGTGVDLSRFDEPPVIKAAAAIDAPNHDAHFDFHNRDGDHDASVFYRSELPYALYTAFRTAWQGYTGVSLDLSLTTTTTSIGAWAISRGAKFVVVSEPGHGLSHPVEKFELYARGYVAGLMALQSAGSLD